MENLGTLTPERESKGPVVGIVVIIVLLILGGVYLWQSKSVELPVDNGTANTGDELTNQLATQGSSIDPQDITADVGATNLDGLDKELSQIGTELGL
ncbi:MAG: hypothetical protein Q7T49_01150 [bacterium]|nr:hypothetical protein [bacterium]